MILTLLADGRVHLSAVRLLAPHLTEANHRDVLREATHKSKREVEQIVARLQPRPDVPASVRKVPSMQAAAPAQPGPVEAHSAAALVSAPVEGPAPRRVPVAPLAPERYKVQFTMSRNSHDKLRRVQDLLRHQIPSGDLATIFDRALTLLLDELERKKLAVTARPRAVKQTDTHGRHVPAAVRRAVWARDEGRCKFEGPAGRCTETGMLEVHHLIPYASGGSTTAENLELRCAAHNRYEAERYFGLFVREVQSQWSTSV